MISFDEFLEELHIDPKEYPQKKGEYKDITSFNQFNSFRGKRRLYLDLLVYVFTGSTAPVAKNDLEAYKIVKRADSKRHSEGTYIYKINAQILYHYVKRFGVKVKSFLDLGCGECKTTAELAKLLEVQGCGSDVQEQFETGWDEARPTSVNFKTITDKNPLGHAGKWDLITAIMVLHHIPDVEKTIAAIAKSLLPGGLLILKEHDCFTYSEEMLVDIEHCMYIVQNNEDWLNKIKSQYIKCRNWIEWAYLMRNHGLTLLHYGPWGYISHSYGNTRKSVLVFQKQVSSIF